ERIDVDPVEVHRRDPIEMIGPLRHRPGEQREQVVDAGPWHGAVMFRWLQGTLANRREGTTVADNRAGPARVPDAAAAVRRIDPVALPTRRLRLVRDRPRSRRPALFGLEVTARPPAAGAGRPWRVDQVGAPHRRKTVLEMIHRECLPGRGAAWPEPRRTTSARAVARCTPSGPGAAMRAASGTRSPRRAR